MQRCVDHDNDEAAEDDDRFDDAHGSFLNLAHKSHDNGA